MTGKDVVRAAMKLRAIGSPTMAKKMGYASAAGIQQRLHGVQDMRVDTLVAMLEALDCEVIVRSKLGDRTKWIIDGKAAEKAKGDGADEGDDLE